MTKRTNNGWFPPLVCVRRADLYSRLTFHLLKPFRLCVCDCAPECVAPEDNMRLPHLYDLRVHLMCHSAVRRLTSFSRRCDDTLDFVPRLRDAQISRSTIDTCVCACLCGS